METEVQPTETSHVEQVADIVSAYISNNSVRPSDLPELIASVHAVLSGLGTPPASAEAQVQKLAPAQVRKSITPDALISFIDGKPYKTLKRHLTTHGMDVQAYRARYGLPSDYPATAANYSAQRSELARTLGLGQQRRKAVPEAPSASAEKPKGRGRPRKAAEAAPSE
ncbi:MucR family transcriptional regulator [Methylobacterium soli]|uniref:MucR family transcriptional regulator n=2 Tax=Methylobacterium soli TaxID=553447 RepID=A0A6L3SSA9_9HYPH|nr:MucR family transcriptional regulator [Methylobacterium soli]KAB1071107.1 MucR family transcriptional regulator [Methylobacterium soli]